MLDNLLATHCAPALVGIKPSNLVSCSKCKHPHFLEELKELNQNLNPKDIFVDVLCECSKRVLLIVYRKKKLTEQLNKAEIQAFLASYGYAKDFSLEQSLAKLRTSISCEAEFPHEIGAFLGYPLEDIHGFIASKGKECLYVGEWKVYNDVESAKKTFSRYKNCKKALLRRVEKGQSLEQIFRAA